MIDQTSITESPEETSPHAERRRQDEIWNSAIVCNKLPYKQAQKQRNNSQPGAVMVFREGANKVEVHTLLFKLDVAQPNKNASQRSPFTVVQGKPTGREIRLKLTLMRDS